MRLTIAALAFCAWVAGCSTTGMDGRPSRTPAASIPAGTPAMIGKTKAEVEAALGKTVAIAFDSGYEVWVYHLRDTTSLRPGTSEYVVLFDPTGVVKKTRVRPAPSGNAG